MPRQRDFHRRNLVAMKEKQEQMQGKVIQQKIERETPLVEWKMRRFQSVESRVVMERGGGHDLQKNPSAKKIARNSAANQGGVILSKPSHARQPAQGS